jgi:hypothetical protein
VKHSTAKDAREADFGADLLLFLHAIVGGQLTRLSSPFASQLDTRQTAVSLLIQNSALMET